MEWLEITLSTAASGVDAATAALTAAGFSEFVIEDQKEFDAFLEANRAYWDYIDESLRQKLQGLSRVKLYLEATDSAGLSRLKAVAGQAQLPMTIAPLADSNWEESWKDSYPPQPVGGRLVVLPCWLADTDTQGRLPVILNPGLTFGTGAHPSTQMVMEAMEALITPGCTCLDLGSGSGILSITALRLGAKSAVGVDIDPKAEDVARENAGYNGFFSPEFTVCTGNVTADRQLMERLAAQQYDIVLVNIVADVIIGLAPVLPRFLKESGTLLCSGILDTRLSEVTAALQAAGLTITASRAREDWRCIHAKRSNL